MNIAKGLAALSLFLSAAVPSAHALAQSREMTQWIVTTGRGTGARGQTYYSTVHLFNPHAVDVSATWTFLPQSALDPYGRALAENVNAPSTTVVVPAGKVIDLGSLWPASGAGAAGAVRISSLLSEELEESLLVTTHSVTSIYAPGTGRVAAGPFIAGQGEASLIRTGEIGRIRSLLAGYSDVASYRSNLVLLSTDPVEETELTLTLFDHFGESRGSRSITLGRLAQTQLNDVADVFDYVLCLRGCPSGTPFPESLEIEVRVLRGGPVAAAGIVIENETGSTTFVPAVRTATP
ncbi:MAG: hypothetical protein ACYDBY_20635 [Thermoanaerobaculia bacterium]